MANRNQATKVKVGKQSQRSAGPAVVAEPAGDLSVSFEWPRDPLGMAAGSSVEAQANWLGKRRLQGAQRRALAAQIGRVQGNQHLQRVVASLRRDEQKHTRRNALPQVTPSPFDLQRGAPETEAGSFALGVAREDQTYLRNEVVAALRATGNPIRVNTADAIRDGILSLDVITRHPEPERHTSEDTSRGTYYFPGIDLNAVIQANVNIAGAARIPGFPANRIYVRVRPHFSHSRPSDPSAFFRKIVHEAQHYLDHHADEIQPRGTDREIFDLWLGYKTEFNAYWADGRFDFYPATEAGRTPTGPRQLRWQAIREFLMTERPYSSRFRWLWTSSPPRVPTGTGEARRIAEWRYRMYPSFHGWFQSQVDGYHEPEAFNRLNSPRIEQFYRALRSRTAGRATRVRSALAALDSADISEIRASARFESLIRRRLRGRILSDVLSTIGFSTTTP